MLVCIVVINNHYSNNFLRTRSLLLLERFLVIQSNQLKSGRKYTSKAKKAY